MSAAQIKGCLDNALEAVALNARQHRVLFNPTPEVDSLAERIIQLADHGVPPRAIRALIDDLRTVLTLNAEEGRLERCLTPALDELARVYRARERSVVVADDLTVRGLVRRLRGDLAIIGAGPGTRGYTAAVLALGDTIRQTECARLESPTLRHELGDGRWTLLQEFMRQGSRS